MKKITKTLTLLLAASCVFTSVTISKAYGEITADEPFDGNAYIQNIYDTYTVTDTMLTSDDLKNVTKDDLFVWGPNSSNCACVLQLDGLGFYLGGKDLSDEWAIFRLHVEALDPEVDPQNQCKHFFIEMLTDSYYASTYNPHYLNIFYDKDLGRNAIGLTTDPDPIKSKTYFEINDSYINDTNRVISSGEYAEIVYMPLPEDEYDWRGFEGVLVDNRTFDFKPENNFGFFKLIPAASVTYDPNGASGDAYTKITKWHEKLEDCSFTYDKKCFIGWNNKPDGTGQPYEVGKDLTLVTDITVYAQWADNPIYGIEDITPMFSLAYQYTYTTPSKTFVEITSLADLEDYDDLMVVAEYNGKTYAMNSNFEGEEVIIKNNEIKASDNPNIDNMYFTADMEFDDWTVLWRGTYMMYLSYYGDLGLSEGTGNGLEIATYNGGTYLGDDTVGEELKKCIICKEGLNEDEEPVLTFVYAEKTNIGTEGWCTSCKLYARHTNPFSNVDFRVRVGLNIYDYIEDVRNFVAPTFDTSKFTDYGFDLALKETTNYVRKQKTYSFVDNDLVYKNETDRVQYINLIFGDCLAKRNQFRLDLSIEITPYVIYDGMKIKSNNKRSYSIREMVEIYYANDTTKSIVTPLYNILNNL